MGQHPGILGQHDKNLQEHIEKDSLREFYKESGNPTYWNNLYTNLPHQVGYKRKKLKDIINKYGSNYSQIIGEAIGEELAVCMQIPSTDT